MLLEQYALFYIRNSITYVESSEPKKAIYALRVERKVSGPAWLGQRGCR